MSMKQTRSQSLKISVILAEAKVTKKEKKSYLTFQRCASRSWRKNNIIKVLCEEKEKNCDALHGVLTQNRIRED